MDSHKRCQDLRDCAYDLQAAAARLRGTAAQLEDQLAPDTEVILLTSVCIGPKIHTTVYYLLEPDALDTDETELGLKAGAIFESIRNASWTVAKERLARLLSDIPGKPTRYSECELHRAFGLVTSIPRRALWSEFTPDFTVPDGLVIKSALTTFVGFPDM